MLKRFAVVASLCVFVATPAFGQFNPWDAVGRLVVDGQPACTMFVVRSEALGQGWENRAVSAGHCYQGADSSYRLNIGRDSFTLRWVWSSTEGGTDILLMSFGSGRQMLWLDLEFDDRPVPGRLVTFLGYGPSTSAAITAPVVSVSPDGQFAVSATVQPGNSGSPVLLEGTRRVVGIVVAYTTIPFVCPPLCYPIPPYYASGVSVLKTVP